MAILERVVVVAVLTVGLSSQVVAESYSFAGDNYSERSAMGEMRSDLTMVHPIKLDEKKLGLAALVDTLPISLGSEGEIDEVWVSAPLNYTFMRPLGGIDSGADANYMHDAVLAE